MLPFTREQFLAVFVTYNEAVWPIHVWAYGLALVMSVLVIRPSAQRSRVVAGGLAAMWLWTGVAYHGMSFSAISNGAWGFAVLFVIQGLLFIEAGVLRGRLAFGQPKGWTAWLGWALVAWASIAYPLLGQVLGHGYPAIPMFGITPCPVTIFTFGLFLLTTESVPRRLLVIPVVWSLIGGSAAFLLATPQDWPLLVSGFTVLALLRRDADRRRDERERRMVRSQPGGLDPSHHEARFG
ncbi:DUF6064 family protein [Hydrogenophaga sp. PAMC20947]|uniref:DUF6064 family protein n=1 Tax=Hydrogenophaga sp. PAMC20947 TaxID=2565558 RepID=UPI001B34C43C|nr:DUF6064 family protein [Hydrogenophaga sp. PAMC20947]